MAENEALKKEIADMRAKMTDYDAMKAENEQLRQAWGIWKRTPTIRSSTPTSSAATRWKNITPSPSTKAPGIEVKDSVIGANGIVGRVIEVGPNYAKVSTILDPSVSIGAIVNRTRDNGLIGSDAELALDKKCTMTLLARDTLAAPGDRITTTGLGGVFPKTSSSARWRILPEASGTSMYAIMEPIEDVESIKMVMVITEFDQ